MAFRNQEVFDDIKIDDKLGIVNKSRCANGPHCMHLGKEEDTVAASLEFVKHDLEEGEFSAGFD
jgi:hypothetical protein